MPPYKKDRGDATRSERKAKRRIAEDHIPDLPGDGGAEEDDAGVDEEYTTVAQQKDKSGNKKRRRDDEGEEVEVVKKKKSRKSKDGEKGSEVVVDKDVEMGDGEVVEKKKSKKERKAEKKALMAAVAEEGLAATETADVAEKDAAVGDAEGKVKGSKKGDAKEKRAGEKPNAAGEKGEEKSGKAPRFIVFVGNLPFTATRASIMAHFAKVAPKDVRNLTEKNNPSKSRGIAFVEFDGYDRMKTCLKLMHHSEFNDGKSAPRKINVELTAGGGGKTKARTEKIKVKNHKLQEERFRAVQENGKVRTEDKDASTPIAGDSNIHPSRRRHLMGVF